MSKNIFKSRKELKKLETRVKKGYVNYKRKQADNSKSNHLILKSNTQKFIFLNHGESTGILLF